MTSDTTVDGDEGGRSRRRPGRAGHRTHGEQSLRALRELIDDTVG